MSDLSADEMINYLVMARIPITASSVDFTPTGLVLRSVHRKATDALGAELSALDYENLKARYDGFVTEARAQAEAKEAAHLFNQPQPSPMTKYNADNERTTPA